MPPASFPDISAVQCLAELPPQGGYFSIIRILPFFLAVLLWAYSTTWVQKGSRKVKVHTKKWTFLTFSGGAVGLALWIVAPWYLAGLVLFAGCFGGAVISFAISVYNPRVAPAQAVLTKAHLNRLLKGGGQATSKKQAAVAAAPADTTERIRIRNSEGKAPPWPTEAQERAAYQAVQDMLFDAIFRRASDTRMDLAPHQPLKIAFRVDGVDRPREAIGAEIAAQVFRQLKLIAGMDVEEHRRPQKGHFKASIGAGEFEKKIDLQVKASGSTTGQRMILRLITDEAKFRLPALGLTKNQLAAVEQLVAEHKGMVICSAPKGNGLTSTFYAILRSHDAFLQHIHTLEMSKDMDLENVTQHQFDGQASGVTFGKKFKSVLRAEPDVCMVCDMPDAETAAAAATAVRQGKKIYLGMAAGDTFSALRKYMETVGDNALAASGLIGLVNQRLMRILCTACRKAYKPDPKLLKKGNLPMDENRPFYRPPNAAEIEQDKHGAQVVCPACQGAGYVGRTGVFEVLTIDKDLRAMIAKGAPLQTVKVEARKKGMQYLQEAALLKVYEGLTSINEVLRVTKEDTAGKPQQAGPTA